MAEIVQIVAAGAVVNAVLVPDDAMVASDRASVTWADGGLTADAGETYWAQEGAQIGWIVTDGALVPAPLSIEDTRIMRIAAVDRRRDGLLALGAPAGGYHIALDEGGIRSDMGSMATTALAAISGAVPWPIAYQRGWITIENIRIPLPTPADGLALAASVGAWYAGLVQHARDLKDALLAAGDEAALDAIDIEAGWPPSEGA